MISTIKTILYKDYIKTKILYKCWVTGVCRRHRTPRERSRGSRLVDQLGLYEIMRWRTNERDVMPTFFLSNPTVIDKGRHDLPLFSTRGRQVRGTDYTRRWKRTIESCDDSSNDVTILGKGSCLSQTNEHVDTRFPSKG